jgi:hypothetical protein
MLEAGVALIGPWMNRGHMAAPADVVTRRLCAVLLHSIRRLAHHCAAIVQSACKDGESRRQPVASCRRQWRESP